MIYHCCEEHRRALVDAEFAAALRAGTWSSRAAREGLQLRRDALNRVDVLRVRVRARAAPTAPAAWPLSCGLPAW